MRMITAVRCPKCLEKGAERKGFADGASVWLCPLCKHEFQIQVLKLKKRG